MIQTGKTPISLMTLCAILSISLVVNLPGLAVTPMLGSLSKVFPGATQLEKQLLTVLPNLLIIPFVLLSGKLSLTRHKRAVVVAGLGIFLVSAVGYLFARSMGALIVISCLLGCGAGLVIPFSTGLIAEAFVGKYRMKEMGVQSGISNSALVAATFAVGWLSTGNWHLPFTVYLVVIIPLLLAFKLKGISGAQDPAMTAAGTKAAIVAPDGAQTVADSIGAAASTAAADAEATKGVKVWKGFYINRLWALIGVYAFITFGCMTITYYCPFLIEKKDWSSSLTGTVTALFFLFMLIPGFTLPWIVGRLRGRTFVWCGVMMAVGLGMFAFVPTSWSMMIGASLAGLGYGISQPLIYDKASRVVTDTKLATLSLALVLSADYIAVVLTPFIIDGLRSLLHASGVAGFAFIVCFVLLTAYLALTILLRRKFVFGVPEEYYSK